MNKTFLSPFFLSSLSSNLKSKIQNLKWAGSFAIALTFVFGGAEPLGSEYFFPTASLE